MTTTKEKGDTTHGQQDKGYNPYARPRVGHGRDIVKRLCTAPDDRRKWHPDEKEYQEYGDNGEDDDDNEDDDDDDDDNEDDEAVADRFFVNECVAKG